MLLFLVTTVNLQTHGNVLAMEAFDFGYVCECSSS